MISPFCIPFFLWDPGAETGSREIRKPDPGPGKNTGSDTLLLITSAMISMITESFVRNKWWGGNSNDKVQRNVER